jgi:hypothetical protein
MVCLLDSIGKHYTHQFLSEPNSFKLTENLCETRVREPS